ncbi:MAG: glycosyltransferase, partial [Acetobacteraceae bacterium]|nr:glycosyltransferase [Acetobacteraceae bacterium]
MSNFFSVIIPTRNRPDLCAVAVQSAAGQYGDEFEVVIVDDGSESGHS